MIKTYLSDKDRRDAYQWSKQVAQVCIDNNRTHSSFDKKVSVNRHYLGYLGELSLARALNLEHNLQIFTGPAQLDNKANQLPDLAKDIEVRTIDKPTLKLIVRPQDIDNYRFALMYYDKKTKWCKALGFVYGFEAKVAKYYVKGQHGLPAYYVPQSDLRPIYELSHQRRYV